MAHKNVVLCTSRILSIMVLRLLYYLILIFYDYLELFGVYIAHCVLNA